MAPSAKLWGRWRGPNAPSAGALEPDAAESAPTPRQPLGVRLAALRQLQADARRVQASVGPPRMWRLAERPPSRRAKGEPLTTEDVAYEIVRPRTRASRRALLDELLPELTAPATYFVSHEWSAEFGDLVDALAHEAADAAEEPVLWLDLVSTSLWPGPAESASAPCARPDAHWDAARTVLLVLSPWESLRGTEADAARGPDGPERPPAPIGLPRPLRRARCLAEAGTALAGGGALRLLLPPDLSVLLDARARVALAATSASLDAVGFEARALLPAADDADVLEAVARRAGGGALLAALVRDELHAWLVCRGRAALDAASADLELTAQLAKLLVRPRAASRAPRAAARAPHAHVIHAARAEAAEADASSAWAAHSLGFGRAESCACPPDGGAEARAPSDSDDGAADEDEGDGSHAPDAAALAEAELLLRRALAARETIGGMHADTLANLHELGCVLETRGQLAEACALLARATSGRAHALGHTHEDTLGSMACHARLVGRLGDGEEAESLYRRALAGMEHALGVTHAATLAATFEFAELLFAEGEASDGEAMLRRAVGGYVRALGEAHPHTLRALERLARWAEGGDDPGEAIALYLRALRGYRSLHGPAHAASARVARRLAAALEAAGEREEAAQVRAEAGGVGRAEAHASGVGGAEALARAARLPARRAPRRKDAASNSL